MNPATLIKEAAADGVILSLTLAGAVKASGDRAAVTRWIPAVRGRKPEIIKALLQASALTGDLGAIKAWLQFIGEHDPAIIADVLDKCRVDADALDYFNKRAAEVQRGLAP
jgi:hypothetical protein